MTPLEDDIDTLFHAVLRAPPVPAVRALYAQLIDSGQIDRVTLERTLRSSKAYRDRRNDPENRDAVTDLVKAASGGVVLGGPFAGMRLADRSGRGDGDLAPKLLGTYEQELHDAIRACRTRRYDAVIDVGCAEGYYAVGLALLFPETPVFAFDTDAVARDIAARNAAFNGCGERIAIGGLCDPVVLGGLYRDRPRSLVLCDCEGYETILFGDAAVNAAGRRADLLIECHDQWDATITPALYARLSSSHEIVRIDQAGRDPHGFACLASLSEWDRWRAVWERRGPAQHWLFCRSRDAWRGTGRGTGCGTGHA